MKSWMLAGSFDPVTNGHIDLIKRAAALFDNVYAVIFNNSEKTYLFSIEERTEMLKTACREISSVIVDTSEKLVVDYAAEHGICAIVRGVRDSFDCADEIALARIYNELSNKIDTVILPSRADLSFVSSKFVREMIKYGHSTEKYVPAGISDYIEKRIEQCRK